MKSNLESISNLERRLTIEVPTEKVNEAFLAAYGEIRKNAEIKGFRKGKAPIDAIRSLYQDRVKQNVIQDLVQKHYVEALTEHKVDPISMPDIQFDDVAEEAPFNFSASFEVRPDVEVKTYEGLEVVKEKLEIQEDQITRALEQMQKSKAELLPVLEDRGAKNGDTAIINFEGFINGAPLENGKAEGHELLLGSNSFIPGFEDGVLGMKIDEEKTINLSFPEEYHAPDVAGKPVDFKVKLTELKYEKLPEMNDEFAKGMGDYEGMDDLKTKIKEDMEKNESYRIKEDLKNRIVKKLVELNPVEVPKSLLEEQKKALIQDFQQRMMQQGMRPEDFMQYQDKWGSDFEDTAKHMIQSTFLMDKIAKDTNVDVSPSDIQTKMEDFANQSGLDLERVKEFYKDPERVNRLKHQITEEKVVDLLIEKATVSEMSSEEIQKLEAPADEENTGAENSESK